jgi:CHASE2 domain-containing sensor protein
MNDLSRRKFLAASGASAIAVGVVSVGSVASASSLEADGMPLDHPEAFEANPVIVSIDDLRAGRISVMHGEREFSVVDADLASRIANLARTGA